MANSWLYLPTQVLEVLSPSFPLPQEGERASGTVNLCTFCANAGQAAEEGGTTGKLGVRNDRGLHNLAWGRTK